MEMGNLSGLGRVILRKRLLLWVFGRDDVSRARGQSECSRVCCSTDSPCLSLWESAFPTLIDFQWWTPTFPGITTPLTLQRFQPLFLEGQPRSLGRLGLPEPGRGGRGGDETFIEGLPGGSRPQASGCALFLSHSTQPPARGHYCPHLAEKASHIWVTL